MTISYKSQARKTENFIQSLNISILEGVMCRLKIKELEFLDIVTKYRVDGKYLYAAQLRIGSWLGLKLRQIHSIIRRLVSAGLIISHYRHRHTCVYDLPESFFDDKIRQVLSRWIPALRNGSQAQCVPLNINLTPSPKPFIYKRITLSLDLPNIEICNDRKIDMFERNPFLPTDYSVSIDQERNNHINREKSPLSDEITWQKQSSPLTFVEKSSTMKPVEQANPFADIGNGPPGQLQEEDMRYKTLQMGRERIDQYSLDTWSGVMGVTPTKRWHEEEVSYTPEEQEQTVKKLLEAYDSPGSIWLKKFIGEDNSDLYLNRVIKNVYR
jgi:hypothetical protein